MRGALEPAIEQPEEPAEETISGALQTVARRAVGKEEARGQGGAEGEGVECGDDRRDCDRQCELPVELSGQAADECRGDEDCTEDQGDGDDRAGHLAHGQPSCLEGRLAELDVPFDVLHHDDGVIDDDADCQHEAEQRQCVQREAEHQHDGERSHQRDGYGHERNDRRAPRLQEHHDHHDDEEDGFEQRLNDGSDRVPHE